MAVFSLASGLFHMLYPPYPCLELPSPVLHLYWTSPHPKTTFSNFSLFQISPRKSQLHDSLHILLPKRLDIPEVGILGLETY